MMTEKKQIEHIRRELLDQIRMAVEKENGCIGTYYKNLGKHHTEDQTCEEHSDSPIVVTHNTDISFYGNFEAATLYGLFIDKKDNRLKCTLNGEAGEDWDELIENIQVEGLLGIVHWLQENKFISYDPWRCKVCGSLNVRAQVWVDSNTEKILSEVEDRGDCQCCDCGEENYPILESELMQIIQTWWEQADIPVKEAVTGIAVAAFAPEDVREGFDYACDKFWERLTLEEKIEKWNDNKKRYDNL